jgi:hypothetical protein
MPTMIVRHTVADFDTWKPFFDEHRAMRQKAGISDVGLYRGASAGNDVLIVFGVEDPERAREFAAGDDMRETMKRAGVISEPTVWFLNGA